MNPHQSIVRESEYLQQRVKPDVILKASGKLFPVHKSDLLPLQHFPTLLGNGFSNLHCNEEGDEIKFDKFDVTKEQI